MRIYKFLDAQFGIKSLSEKRLKISRLHDLNDPFELIPYDLSNRRDRFALQQSRQALARNHGMLCFSKDWKDPVLWAHYSDKHRGVCIGFEIPDDLKICKPVKYVSERLPFPKMLTLDDIDEGERILFTKYDNWKYEQEIRFFVGLTEEEDGLFFKKFDEILRPVVVIAGARCSTTKQELFQALGPLMQSVKLIKARAGFKRFEIVEDQRGFR
ncbi:MAG: hypothetical protein JWO20_2084 [Candidatus Angelobacter sp.]|jgi:hypothetical protein|nr:hypothetical protein [Candidatus Angelobacter sp.]